jgi:hypothetical protein
MHTAYAIYAMFHVEIAGSPDAAHEQRTLGENCIATAARHDRYSYQT